jgi:hypothetical protein
MAEILVHRLGIVVATRAAIRAAAANPPRFVRAGKPRASVVRLHRR